MSQGAPVRKVSVSEIKSKFLRPALTSHYICNFGLPPALNNPDSFISKRVSSISPTKLYDRLSLSCSDANLPGSSLATHEINNDYTGVTERHAYRRLYDERIDFSFYVDAEEYYVINLFESWIGYAMGEQYRSSRTYNYRAEYPNNYCTDTLSITKFERDLAGRTLQYNFVKAFPISIQSMPVSYDSSQLLKCTVSFTYSRYWIEGLNLQGKPGEPGQTTASGVPTSPFDITPQRLAEINSIGFNSNISFNNLNISSGTVFDAGLDDPTRVFQNAELDRISSNFRF